MFPHFFTSEFFAPEPDSFLSSESSPCGSATSSASLGSASATSACLVASLQLPLQLLAFLPLHRLFLAPLPLPLLPLPWLLLLLFPWLALLYPHLTGVQLYLQQLLRNFSLSNCFFFRRHCQLTGCLL